MSNDREMVKITFVDHLQSTRYCEKHMICSPHVIYTKLYGVSTLVILILQMRKYSRRLSNLPRATWSHVSQIQISFTSPPG